MNTIPTFIFDLDGVITDTENYHFHAWKSICLSLNYNLSPEKNEELKGVSRSECLDKILKWAKLNVSKDEFDKIRAQIQKNIEDYRLDFAINEVYEFFWSKFCDVYIEECKKSGETANLRPMLKEILVMMHPFAPFITEEIHTLLFESQIID